MLIEILCYTTRSNHRDTISCRQLSTKRLFSVILSMALRSKNVKVQPIEEFNLKRHNQEFIENEGSLELELQNKRLSCRNLYLQSIPEETLKGTPESSKSSVKDELAQNPVSVERIRKEVYSLRVLVIVLVVVSFVSLALNIWVIRRVHAQNGDCSLDALDKGIQLVVFFNVFVSLFVCFLLLFFSF